MTTYCDPPEGWKYGFPKVYDIQEGESFTQWLVRQGYPDTVGDLVFAEQHSRFWEE